MKKFRFITFLICFFSVLLTGCFCVFLVIPLYNCFGTFILPIWAIISYVMTFIVHDYICMSVVCSLRKKYNICDECYFWTCPHYSVCPYNLNK